MSIGHKLAIAVELVCLALAVALSTAWAEQPPLEGSYRGMIEIPGIEMEITVNFSRGADGSWNATMDVPAQGALGLPLDDVACTADGAVKFVLNNPNGASAFNGRYHADTRSISGEFSQNGLSFPFYLVSWDPDAEAAIALGRLEGLTEEVATMMGTLHTPGLAVGIVLDGEVLYTETLGYRDVENELPVTADTLFTIGSTGKAFTATAIGMLADDGIVDWDEPVTAYLPDFKMYDPVATANLTLRDLCSQRSGLPRHELTWLNADITRDNLFGALGYLEPSKGFREGFQYSNLNYMAAGVIAGRAAGTDWEELVSRRILGPLKMDSTVFSYSEMTAAPDHARGYRWEDCAEDGFPCYQPMGYTDLEVVGPAGSIHSNLNDMLKWVQFHLGDGSVNGEKLLSLGQQINLHSPQVIVPGVHGQFPGIPLADYGLGWLVYPYRGHYCLEHEGFINGFSAAVCLLPDDGIGIVVLGNGQTSQLPKVVAYDICDRLLEMDPAQGGVGIFELLAQMQSAGVDPVQMAQAGDAENEAEPVEPALPLADYCGLYTHPAYGEFTVSEADGELVGLFRDHELKFSCIGAGRFAINCNFDSSESYFGMLIPSDLEFRQDDEGAVTGMAVPFEPQVAPIVFEHDGLTRTAN